MRAPRINSGVVSGIVSGIARSFRAERFPDFRFSLTATDICLIPCLSKSEWSFIHLLSFKSLPHNDKSHHPVVSDDGPRVSPVQKPSTALADYDNANNGYNNWQRSDDQGSSLQSKISYGRNHTKPQCVQPGS